MRLKIDYDQSHMLTPICINIPTDLMNGKGYRNINFYRLKKIHSKIYLDGHHGELNLH